MPALTLSAIRKRRIGSRKRAALAIRILVLVLVIAILGAGIWAWQARLPARVLELMFGALTDANSAAGLMVADVTLIGRSNASRAELIAALAVNRGDPILAVAPRAARERLEALGWVEKASVARRMPGQVLVHIVERRPFALWQNDGALFLIDRSGAVISDQGLARFAVLPVVVGGDAAGRAGDLMDMLANQPELFTRVRAAVRVGGRRWDIHLDNDVTVRLPESGAAEAWGRLAELNDSHGIIDRALLSIDLRLPDRLVVRLATDPAPDLGVPGEGA